MLFKREKRNFMNECIISGEILEDIKFEFIYDSKHISIAMCNVKLNNNSVLKIYRT